MYLFIGKKLNERLKFVTGIETVKPVEVTVRTDFKSYGRKKLKG